MNSVEYRIYYSPHNQGGRAPLQDDEIALALERFPNACDYKLPHGESSVSVVKRDENAIVVLIRSSASLNDIRDAVSASADSLQLYGSRLESAPPII